jgi:hypothetical protein
MLRPVTPQNTVLTDCSPSLETTERFLWKALRMIVDAPWYVPNTVIRRDYQTPTVKEEIRLYSSQYSGRLTAHPNGLEFNLMELPDNRRLRRSSHERFRTQDDDHRFPLPGIVLEELSGITADQKYCPEVLEGMIQGDAYLNGNCGRLDPSWFVTTTGPHTQRCQFENFCASAGSLLSRFLTL